MLDIITVRVTTGWTVKMCSHSDKESYKNLGQSESRWLNWSCSCSNTITHYWHTETNTATTHELKTELRVKSASLDCDLSWDRWVWLCYAQNNYYYTSKHWERSNVCVMLVYLQNDLISRWFKQRINYIEKANKEHYQQKSESIKPLRRKMIHCFEALQSDRESFVSERDFKVLFANHLFPSGTSKRVSRIIWFRAGLQSAFRESFVSERDFKACFANHLFQSGTSKRVSRIICFERDFKARFANHLFPSGTSNNSPEAGMLGRR